jgi:hypothetical protein
VSLIRSSPSGPKMGRLLRGANFAVDESGRLSPSACSRRYFDWDYFISGASTSGRIGRMGWTLLGLGTPAFVRQNASLSSPAKARLETSDVAGNFSTLTLGNIAGRQAIMPTSMPIVQWAWRMGGSIANKRVFFGWTANFSQNPFVVNTNVFGVFYDPLLSPNYLVLNKINNFASFTPIDTGVAVPPNSGELFSIVQSPQNPLLFDFSVVTEDGGNLSERYLARDVLISATNSSNMGFFVQTLDASSSVLEFGYWGAVNTFGGLYTGALV